MNLYLIIFSKFIPKIIFFKTLFINFKIYFSYLIERDVCYLVLCEKNFSKRSAFSFLEDIAAEFNRLYGRQVATVSRPYTLIEFGNVFLDNYL